MCSSLSVLLLLRFCLLLFLCLSCDIWILTLTLTSTGFDFFVKLGILFCTWLWLMPLSFCLFVYFFIQYYSLHWTATRFCDHSTWFTLYILVRLSRGCHTRLSTPSSTASTWKIYRCQSSRPSWWIQHCNRCSWEEQATETQRSIVSRHRRTPFFSTP